MIAPPHANESARLDALRALAVLDTPPEADFDDLTRLAAAICGTPIALVSLVDSCRQWFKSRHGIDAKETPRDIAFCAHAILGDEPFVVEDAAADDRFRDNPLVTGEPHLRFYAGVPLRAPDGHNVGTLCVIDRVPRTLSDAQRDALTVLARQVVAQLRLRWKVRRIEESEAGLRASEERFRQVVDELAEGVVLLDYETRAVLRANRAFRDMLGYSADEAAALTQYDFAAHDRTDIDGHMRRVVAAGRHDLGYRQYRRKDGSVFDVSVSGGVLTHGGRAVLSLVVRDMTAEKKAEDALRESEERLRLAAQAADVGIWEWNVLTGQIQWDAEMFRLYGVPPTPNRLVTYPTWSGAVLPEDLPHQEAVLQDTFRRLGNSKRTFRIRRPDGEIRYIEAAETVRRNDAGEAAWVVGTNVDVTGRKRAEDALRESEAKFRGIVDRLAEGLFVMDPDSRQIVEANAAILDMLGYTRAEFFARSVIDLLLIESPTAVALDVILAHHGHCDLGRQHFRRKDGGAVPVEVRVTLVPHGRTGLYAVIVRDLTEQVAAEERLFEYQSGWRRRMPASGRWQRRTA